MRNHKQHIVISTSGEFSQFLKTEIAIIWFHVDWSGTAMHTQKRFLKFLETHPSNIPVYQTDCSQQNLPHVEEWLKNQSLQKFNYLSLYLEGNGEMALVKEGVISDYLYRPNMMSDIVFENKLSEWTSPRSDNQ
jgi:hypothetical protein